MPQLRRGAGSDPIPGLVPRLGVPVPRKAPPIESRAELVPIPAPRDGVEAFVLVAEPLLGSRVPCPSAIPGSAGISSDTARTIIFDI